MNVIDVVVVLMILCAGVVGFKRGVFKQLVMTVGLLLVYILAFKLKDPLANWLSLNLPFFNFAGIFEGATSLNIILYQTIAFLIMFSLLMIVFRVILSITGFLEKVLKFTIILAIPSKILGFIVGLIEGYIIMFVVLFILSQPFLKIDVVEQSKFREPILNSSPILSNITSSTNDAIKDIYNLQKNFIDNKNTKYFNEEVVRILLRYDIVSKDYINKLIDKGKINVNV